MVVTVELVVTRGSSADQKGGRAVAVGGGCVVLGQAGLWAAAGTCVHKAGEDSGGNGPLGSAQQFVLPRDRDRGLGGETSGHLARTSGF